MLLSDEEIASVLADTETPGLYTDPCLAHNPRAYASFVVRLYKAGLLRFDVKTRSQVGFFCVTKKRKGSLRLVIDARRVNRLFKKAPWCPLGSIESLCRVRIPKDETLFIAQEDVKDFFYRFGIDKDLSQFLLTPGH